MAKSIDLPGYFTCSSCVQKNLERDDDTFNLVHLEPGKALAGTRYCELCAEELLDELVIKVHERLLRGKFAWDTSHVLSFYMHRGIYEVTLTCPCRHEGVRVPFVYCLTKFKEFWNLLASVVEQHYVDLKKIIDR